MKLTFLLLALLSTAHAKTLITCDDGLNEKYLLDIELETQTGIVYKYENDSWRQLSGKVLAEPGSRCSFARVTHTPDIKIDWKEGECFRYTAPIIRIEVRGDDSTIWKRAQVVINPEVKNCSYPRVEPGPIRPLSCSESFQ